MSTPRPASPQQGLRLSPFRGLRYAPDRVGSLSAVTSPPYDVVVRPDGLVELESADPYNVVRLILPRDGDPATRYVRAAATLRRWQQDGILVPDPLPALYVYEQRLPDGEVQRGLIGALRLSDPPEGTVLPHEEVMPAPVADRAGLMRATAANLEPLLLTYRGDGSGATAALIERTAVTPPLFSLVGEDGRRHRLWALSAPEDIAAIDADLAPRQALIADGHHRWATYLRLRDERPAPGPWDRGLVLLVDSTRYPLRVRAIHRVLHRLPVADALAAARDAFRVEEVEGPLESALATLATAAKETGNAFLLAGDGAFHLLSAPDQRLVERTVRRDRPEAWRRLDAAILHGTLIDHLWRVPDEPDRIGYVHDAPAAVAQAERLGGTAVLMHPVPEATVLELARNGVMMPHKSTSFGPKPASGLVLRSLELE